jgi:AcrR family transcriptional regulator
VSQNLSQSPSESDLEPHPAAEAAPACRPAEQWAEADHARRCELIVECSLQVLHEHGRAALTMRRVAGRLGIGAMTLYTYFDSQEALWRAMVRRGFEMLRHQCDAASTLHTAEGWRGGARSYLRFALENPNLYKLMFDTPMAEDDSDLLEGGFEALLDKVRQRFAEQGETGQNLTEHARRAAGRYWIALHGLAMLAIAGRLSVLDDDIDALLDDLLPRIAPT